ncbi:MAG: DUF1028 domain-containing protein, partial [Dehalococcoidales bacterium]|nr:DUF1028 domain-containing protein [Dehalococcoidales bacterium]
MPQTLFIGRMGPVRPFLSGGKHALPIHVLNRRLRPGPENLGRGGRLQVSGGWGGGALGAGRSRRGGDAIVANTSFGPRGLEMLTGGLTAEETLSRLLADDPERVHRQVEVVDGCGGSATFTGKDCFAWAGGVTGSGYAIQGNILAGDQVVLAMQKAFLETKG